MSEPARRRPQQARSRQKVESILAAARRLLETEGPDAFNTNRIAREAGVSVGSVYEYFPNKQAIVARLIDEIAAVESDAVLAILEEGGDAALPEVLRTVVVTILGLYREHSVLLRTLWAMATHPRDVGHRPGEQLVMAEIRRRIERLEGSSSVRDVELAVFTVFHMVDSLAEQFALSGLERWEADRCADEITAAVLGYLGIRR